MFYLPHSRLQFPDGRGGKIGPCRDLSPVNAMESTEFYSLVAKLGSTDEMERQKAVHSLYRDKRGIPYLLRILADRSESPIIRGDAAELLKFSRKAKVIRALVEFSEDPSAEVRFWCVFALGRFVRRRKTRLAVVRALEARLGDLEYPDIIGYWPVGLEALAMLQGCRQTRYPVDALFRETILKVMRDPLKHPSKWSWANCYWRDEIAGSVEEGQSLQTAAAYQVSNAGFDPMTFGRRFPTKSTPSGTSTQISCRRSVTSASILSTRPGCMTPCSPVPRARG